MSSSPAKVPIIDTFIRMILLVGLFVWCSFILAPFIYIVIWGMIIAISTYPVFTQLEKKLWHKEKLAAMLLMMIGLILVAIPGYYVFSSVLNAVSGLKSAYLSGTLNIPPPSADVEQWPLIGHKVFELWTLASTNVTEVISRYQETSMSILTWVGSTVGKFGFELLQFTCSIIVAGILLMYTKQARAFTLSFFTRVMGERGPAFASIAEKTVRNVTRGIIGVAFIQAAAAGVGFVLAGVPLAGPLTLLCLVLCIVQLGVGLVVIPVILYAFSAFGTLHAVMLSIWLVIILFSDNILKPIFLAKGAPVPTLIIFIGSIGGFLLSGLIGLFIGAVVLSLGYRLFTAWVHDHEQTMLEED
jgi:predicted PurR-regulated permease PerM